MFFFLEWDLSAFVTNKWHHVHVLRARRKHCSLACLVVLLVGSKVRDFSIPHRAATTKALLKHSVEYSLVQNLESFPSRAGRLMQFHTDVSFFVGRSLGRGCQFERSRCCFESIYILIAKTSLSCADINSMSFTVQHRTENIFERKREKNSVCSAQDMIQPGAQEVRAPWAACYQLQRLSACATSLPR